MAYSAVETTRQSACRQNSAYCADRIESSAGGRRRHVNKRQEEYDEFFDDRELKQRAQRSLKPHFNQKYLVKCTVFRGIFPKYEKKSSDKEPQRLLKDN